MKKVPERMCVACREMKPKQELVRLVLTESGATVDLTGKMNGRGVYLCKCTACVERAKKNKNFAKVHGFALDEALVSELEKLIEK